MYHAGFERRGESKSIAYEMWCCLFSL